MWLDRAGAAGKTWPVRFAIETHGCRLNQAESDMLVEQLRARGHEQVSIEHADLYVLNSCAITHAADADARAAVRRARRGSDDVRVVLTGCYANADPDRLAHMPELDAVLGNVEKRGPELIGLLEGLVGSTSAPKLVAVERLTRRVRPAAWAAPETTQAPSRTRPLLKVQDGCDQSCSFCIVPQVRGRSRSATIEQSIARLGALVDAGAPEVVLTGAHLGSWGRELGPDAGGLPELLAALLHAHPAARLRLGSVDPHEVDEHLIALLGAGVDERGAGLCQHVHLPVQSGDDGVLRAMRRAHRAADLELLLPRLRAVAPELAIGTDLIVGFPGESEAAFERSVALLEHGAIPFAHVFVWSPRSHTAAVELGDRVSADTAARRSRVLRERVADSHRRFVAGMQDTRRSAVIMRRRSRRTGCLTALTDNFLRVRVDGADSLLGRRVQLRVETPTEPLDTGHMATGRILDVA